VFHNRAAATGNARWPRLDRLVAGANRVDVEPDLRKSTHKMDRQATPTILTFV